MKLIFKDFSPRLQLGLKIFFGLCVFVTLLDIVVHKHGDHWWNFFGFHSLYGFVACVLLVLVATWMRKPLMKSEDYYGVMDEGSATDSGNDSGNDSRHNDSQQEGSEK